MARWRASVLAETLFVASLGAACGNGGGFTTTTSIAPGPYASQAEQVMTDLASGNFQAVYAMEDPVTQLHLTVAVLASGWSDFTGGRGAYRGHGRPELHRIGSLDVEIVPLTMANGPAESQVTFNPAENGEIISLLLTRAGEPVGA